MRVVTKEQGSGTYRLSAYYLSLMTSEAPVSFVLPVIYVSVSYWMVNLTRKAGNFICYMLLILLSVLTSQVRSFQNILICNQCCICIHYL